MEYVYAALLLHKAGQGLKPKKMEEVLTAAGVFAELRIEQKVLLVPDGVDIDDALKSAAAMPVAAAPAAGGAAAPAAEEKKEEEKEEEADVAVGLGSLFG